MPKKQQKTKEVEGNSAGMGGALCISFDGFVDPKDVDKVVQAVVQKHNSDRSGGANKQDDAGKRKDKTKNNDDGNNHDDDDDDNDGDVGRDDYHGRKMEVHFINGRAHVVDEGNPVSDRDEKSK